MGETVIWVITWCIGSWVLGFFLGLLIKQIENFFKDSLPS